MIKRGVSTELKEEKRVAVGMIGCGAMGRSIANRLLAIDSRIRVVALYDPDPNSIRNALEQIDPEPIVCDDLESLIESPEIDWVMIASWNCFHKEQTVAALEAGKHVFCQKPLATTLEDCRAIYQSWRESGRMFNIGLTLRYSPHYRKIKELLQAGSIGEIVSLEFNETLDFNHGGYIHSDWRRFLEYAGTHLLEKCCHDIDLANWMVESEAARVASFGGLNFFRPENVYHIERIGQNREGQPAYCTWRGSGNVNPFTVEKDIVDNQVAIIEYANGVRATFHTNCNSAIPERRMYILGAEGAIRADVITGKIEVRRIGFDTELENVSAGVSGGHGGGDNLLVKELADSMLRGSPPKVGIEEGLRSALTCFAIDEAMETGAVVDLAPYWNQIELDAGSKLGSGHNPNISPVSAERV